MGSPQVPGSSPDSATVADAPATTKSPLKTKTFWIATAWAIFHIATDYKNPAAWENGIGAIGVAYSARDAISKNGYGL